jgi:hypothetical protein
MALTQVTGPYPIFTDLDGSPLDDGYLYIGAINQDPETNPIQVFWDSALTIPATQPIRTNSGYPYRNGTPALMYTGGQFSITIRNKRQEFVLYSPVGYGFDPAAVSASVVKNDFIGNGVQVAFVLSASPSTILATNIFINGVYQEKDSYTLSGNTITFSIAPPLNSSIEVLTNETGVIGTTNATLVSYTLTAPGAVAQTVQTRLEQYVSVKDFGAVGDGVADDTAAIQAAVDAVFSAGGGTIYIPTGTYLVSSIVKSWTGAVTVRIQGSGKRAAKIKKKSGTTTPIFDFSSAPGILDTYSEVCDLWLEGLGAATEAGLRVTDWARWTLKNVLIESTNKGLHSKGALALDVYDCTFQSNVYGYYCEKSAANIYSNLVQFFGGQIGANTTWGMAIQQAAGVHLYGTDLSANGVAGNPSTGGIIVDANVDDESGYSVISLNGVWMEANNGCSLRVGNATGLMLTLKDVFLTSNENVAGVGVVNIGTIFSSKITNATAGGATDTFYVAAGRSTVVGGIINTLNDTSTRYRHINVTTSGTDLVDVFKGAYKQTQLSTIANRIGQSSAISGGGADNFEIGQPSGEIVLNVGSTRALRVSGGALGFFNGSPVAKPTITGSRGGNAALASLLTNLAGLGLITDSTT